MDTERETSESSQFLNYDYGIKMYNPLLNLSIDSILNSQGDAPIGLWGTVLKPQVWQTSVTILFFGGPDVTVFGQEGGAGEVTHCYQ